MAIDHMTIEEKEFGERVDQEVRRFRKSYCVSVIDISIAHKLGFTPEETAEAIIGINNRVLSAIINSSPKEPTNSL